MKKLMAALLVLTLCAGWAMAEMPDVVLFTSYLQCGWGDRLEAGCMDADGNLYTYALEQGGSELPYDEAELCAYLFENNMFEPAGRYGGDMEALRSLAMCVPAQETVYSPAACDAGTESSFAVRGDEWILLGASGDDMFENTDPTAQALYLILRRALPGVTSNFGEAGMGPEGFPKTDILTFLGCAGADIENAVLAGYEVDCEAGLIPRALSQDEADRIRAIMRGSVTGKASCISVTGGTDIYAFADDRGETVASVELYRDLLVTDDGMYNIEY